MTFFFLHIADTGAESICVEAEWFNLLICNVIKNC